MSFVIYKFYRLNNKKSAALITDIFQSPKPQAWGGAE